MDFEICIPAYNEESIIAEAARTVVDLLRTHGKRAIVTVVDSASTDKTAERARAVTGVSVLPVSIRGKGAAVVAAANSARAPFFGFIDADLSADPADIIELLAILERNDADVVIGSRLIDTSIIQRGIIRTVLSRGFNMVRRWLVGIDMHDTQCGLKLMNVRGREQLAMCKETGWFFDMEFLVRAERRGLRIQEVPVHWDEARFPARASKLSHVRDSIGAVAAMMRIRRHLRGDILALHDAT